MDQAFKDTTGSGLELESWALGLGQALAFVDADGVCLWRNGSASDLLGRGAVLELRDGRIVAVDARENAQLESRLRKGVTEPFLEVIFSPGATDRLVVHGAWMPGERAVAALTMRNPASPSAMRLPNLERVFQLTASEQEIVERLMANASPEDIAKATKRSLMTVRTHIKRAYKKLGVGSRAEMVQRLAGYCSPY